MSKELGYIENVRFGLIDGHENLLGLELAFDLSEGSIGTSYCCNAKSKNGESYADDLCEKIVALLEKAGVHNISELVGLPVEVTIENMAFKDFRILNEVIPEVK